jgi:lysophospholipase L1-like esterase
MKKRVCLLGLIALIVALIVSIQLNIQLYREAADNYRDLNGVRLDPLGLNVYAAANQQSLPAERSVVVFIGDSRAAEWTAPNLSNFTFVNRGIGAQTTAQVLGRFAQDVAPLRPGIAVIQVGINDLKALPLFPEQRASIVQNTKDNIMKLIQLSLDAGAKRVVVTTIFPLGEIPWERRLVWSADVAVAIDEVNSFLASLASDRVEIMNTSAIIAQHETVLPVYRRDFLHLNPAGYAALNQELEKLLAR